MTDHDKILKFPGSAGVRSTSEQAHQPEGALQPPAAIAFDRSVTEGDTTVGTLVGPDGIPIMLTPEQGRAITLITSGMAFVFIGIKPTPTGADFFRVIHGEAADLRNAHDAVHSQVDKAYDKRGLL